MARALQNLIVTRDGRALENQSLGVRLIRDAASARCIATSWSARSCSISSRSARAVARSWFDSVWAAELTDWTAWSFSIRAMSKMVSL